MELIQVDDVRKQIVELRKLVRVVDASHHATLTDNTVREVDFSFSTDMEWVEADTNSGLSFATNMKKFKKLIKSKARFQAEVDIFVIDESLLIVEGLRIIHDRPGHASLTVTRRMKLPELIKKLEIVALKLESIGRVRIIG